jgi:hypothetical protein
LATGDALGGDRLRVIAILVQQACCWPDRRRLWYSSGRSGRAGKKEVEAAPEWTRQTHAVEIHHRAKARVAGSNPVFRSRFSQVRGGVSTQVLLGRDAPFGARELPFAQPPGMGFGGPIA